MNENIRTVLQQIEPLTDRQILDAKQEAVQLTLRDIGAPPDRAQFERYAATSTPRSITLTVGLILGAATLAAFALSVFRVFTAGRDLFLQHIDDPLQAAIAGLATFLLAELLVIGSMLARAVYFTGDGKHAMTATAGMGVLVALLGNLVVSRPPGLGAPPIDFVFAWMDALAAPLAVLLVALAFERMVIGRVQQHQDIERRYQEALHDHQKLAADPENSALFQRRYFPGALKKAIQEANSTGRGSTARRDLMARLRPEHWNWLVLREVRASEWYDPDAELPVSSDMALVAASSNGHHTGNPTPAPALVSQNGANGRH